jgi:hypothetical protein
LTYEVAAAVVCVLTAPGVFLVMPTAGEAGEVVKDLELLFEALCRARIADRAAGCVRSIGTCARGIG